MEWKGIENTGDTPIFHIHGENDLVLPVKNTTPDAIVAGAGHALSMSHPSEVTEFLKQKIAESMAHKGIELTESR